MREGSISLARCFADPASAWPLASRVPVMAHAAAVQRATRSRLRFADRVWPPRLASRVPVVAHAAAVQRVTRSRLRLRLRLRPAPPPETAS